MNTIAPANPSPVSESVTPITPHPMGRPSGYSEETVGRLCEVIRRRGLADAAAAQSVGMTRMTLWRWKQDHPELEDWLAMAREQYREAKLSIVDEAKTRDGRPDWRAATWALARAFPEDYGRAATAKRAGAGALPPEAEMPSEGFSLAQVLEHREKELQEYLRINLTPEMKELIRQENEESERWAREGGEAS